ncbi:MAG: serine peptidase, partial [Pseudomonadota bacterium]|nr:serine peptidase [Pseudomonadota bacterium]
MRKASIFFSMLISALVILGPVNGQAAKPNDFGLPDFSTLVENTNQSVVNISTTKQVERQVMPEFRGVPEDLLRHFFGLPQF